ncbi:MAG TPA: hypothetical protein VHX68_16355 [Planctomycetaceae bacterium]|nr:hypothetical protein [Planctomycetaceae bacterium]
MDRLVRLVGPEAGLCVEVPRLDEALTAFKQGEFFRRLERSKFYAEWMASPKNQAIANLATFVDILSAKPARPFVRDVLGTAVVIAAYTEPGPKMSAILLSQAVSHESLEGAIKAWIHLEECRVETVQFGRYTYRKRVSAEKTDHAGLTLYYATLDRTLLLSDREELVRRALTLSGQTAAHATLFDLPAYQQSQRSLSTNCAVRAYINPRAFDEILGIDPEPASVPSPAKAGSALTTRAARPSAPSTKSSVCKVVEAAWRRFEWLALGVEIDRGIVLEGVAHYSSAGLSKQAERFLHSLSGTAEIFQQAPSNACVVLAGRQPFGGLFRGTLKRQAKQWLSADFESVRQVSRGLLLGFDLFDNIVPLIRGNVGGYLVPRYGAKPGELPFEGLVAAELSERPPAAPEKVGVQQSGQLSAKKDIDTSTHRESVAVTAKPSSDLPTAREAIENALNTGLNYLAARFNMTAKGAPAIVRTESVKNAGTRIRWVDGLKACQPAYAQTPRFLILATSPQLVRNFVAREATNKTESGPNHGKQGRTVRSQTSNSIQVLARRYFPTENQVLYIDAAAVRRMIAAHRAELVQYASSTHLISPAAADESLSQCLDIAGVVDKVFAAMRLGDGTARIVIGGIVNGPTPSESAATR